MMTKTKVWGLGLLVAVSAAACGGDADRTPEAAATPVQVTLGTAALTAMADSFEAGGTVVARQTAVISSRVLAPVLRVAVQPGAMVRRGQVLVELDAENMTASAAGATSSLEAARASARAAESEQTAAEAGLALARATHARIEKLQQDRSATAQELDEALSALRQAEARLAAVTAQVEAVRRSVDAAQAGAQVATITRGWATLTAPFDGRVVARHVDPGTTVGPGQPLVTIEATGAQSGLQMDVRLDATRAAGLTLGQTAEIRVETGGTSEWTSARVTKIARVDPASHSFTVTLEPVGTPDAGAAAAAWQSGYFGRARFAGAARERLTVPQSTIVTRGQLTFVYLVGADDYARLRVISVGEARDGRVEVLSGLSAGDRVVLDPPATLTDGQKVRS
jgi:RND family efflux transporter MFP subunit